MYLSDTETAVYQKEKFLIQITPLQNRREQLALRKSDAVTVVHCGGGGGTILREPGDGRGILTFGKKVRTLVEGCGVGDLTVA